MRSNEGEGRDLCSEAEVRRVMGPDGAQVVVNSIRDAWQDYRELGQALRPTPQANYVWDRMITRAIDEFADFEGVEMSPIDKSFLFTLHERFALRFKRLSSTYRTANILTKAQRNLQHFGHLDDMPSKLPVISCGYTLDPTGSEIDKVLAVRELDHRVEWWFDLDELAGGEFAPVFPIFPELGPDLPSLPAIRRIKRTQDGDNS